MAGGYVAQPDDIGQLDAQLRKLQEQIDALTKGLKSIGLHVDGPTGNLIVDSNALLTANFDGTLSPPAAGTTGVAIVNDTIVVNTLIAKNLLIDDDALTSPVKADVADGVASGFSPNSSMATRITKTIAVPAGFTTALVMAVSTAGLSANASGSFSAVRTVINGSVGDTITSQAGANIAMSVNSAQSAILTGLSGSFDVATQSSGTTGGVVAGSGNARIAASVVFLR